MYVLTNNSTNEQCYKCNNKHMYNCFDGIQYNITVVQLYSFKTGYPPLVSVQLYSCTVVQYYICCTNNWYKCLVNQIDMIFFWLDSLDGIDLNCIFEKDFWRNSKEWRCNTTTKQRHTLAFTPESFRRKCRLDNLLKSWQKPLKKTIKMCLASCKSATPTRRSQTLTPRLRSWERTDLITFERRFRTVSYRSDLSINHIFAWYMN